MPTYRLILLEVPEGGRPVMEVTNPDLIQAALQGLDGHLATLDPDEVVPGFASRPLTSGEVESR